MELLRLAKWIKKYLELNCPVNVKTIPFGIDTSKYELNNKSNKVLNFFILVPWIGNPT